MTVTKILQSQAGIQYDKPQDKSAADPRDSLNNVVFTGQFKRGRFDKPMKVYASNLRAALGYDPDNMDYVAIEDALATGVPFVWVQRVKAQSSENCTTLLKISPDLLYSWSAGELNASIYWSLEVDGVIVTDGIKDSANNHLESYLQDNSVALGITGSYMDEGGVTITKITETHKDIRLIPRLFDESMGVIITDVSFQDYMTFSENPSVQMDAEGVISFCLSGTGFSEEPEEPEPEITFVIEKGDLVFRTEGSGSISCEAFIDAGDQVIDTVTGLVLAEASEDMRGVNFYTTSGTYVIRRSPAATNSTYWVLSGKGVVEIIQLPESEFVNWVSFYYITTSCINLIKVPDYLPPNLTNMGEMFENCSNFNQDLSMWDVSNVTNMREFLKGALKFNSPLFKNTSKVTSMFGMFWQATAFNQKIDFDTSSVTDMEYMLKKTPSFNQDLSTWCVPLITKYPNSFASDSALILENMPVWGTCPNG